MAPFKETFDKNHRPTITELEDYLQEDVFQLFQKFTVKLLTDYSLSFAVPTWSEKHGWVYRIGWSGVMLITGITMEQDCFTVLNHKVTDLSSYDDMLETVIEYYEGEKDRFLNEIKDKNRKQSERSKLRTIREAATKAHLASRIHPDRYNRFHWPKKLPISRLRELYRKDAMGLNDEDLADDIGFGLYTRCKYGKEDMQLLNQYQLRCHGCGTILTGTEDFRECSCGEQYSYKEYRRSYRRNNMPTGAAARVFDEFTISWPLQRDYSGKMCAIDTLLHEFHLNLVSGAVHRPVAMNFIEGTKEQIERIILELALE